MCRLFLATLLAIAPLSLRAQSSQLLAEGIVFSSPDLPSWLSLGTGPRDGVPAMTATADTVVRGRLTRPLQDRGTLMFWFRTDRTYRSGIATEYFEQRLVEIDNLVAASFVVERESVTLYIGWGKRRDVTTSGARGVRRGIAFDQIIRIILPEWPGPAWHHLAICWDATAGKANAFVNGTPYERPGSTVDSWAALPGHTATLHLGPRFALAGLRVSPDPHPESTLAGVVGPEHRGALDRLLGVSDLGPLDVAKRRGALLYQRSLEKAEDIRGWVLEGPGKVTFGPDGMTMRSLRPDGPNGHLVHWIDREFPADFIAEFDFEVLTEHGLNILFFSGRGTEGQDAFDPGLTKRDGTFIQYTHGDLNTYHISYFANSPNDARSVANLRKNSGFFLLANGPVGVMRGGLGETHHATLIKEGAHIRMAVDGRLIIDFTDDGRRAGPVWSGGKMAFRQMQWSSTRYHHLRIYGVK